MVFVFFFSLTFSTTDEVFVTCYFPQSLLAAESTREGEKLQNKRGFPVASHVFSNTSTLVLAVTIAYFDQIYQCVLNPPIAYSPWGGATNHAFH